jgi:hypothetical protein
MSPPGPEKERPLTTTASGQEGSEQRDAITAPAKIKLLVFQDWCIEDWLSYLEHEHHRLGGGPSGGHILHCLRASYAEFLCSGLQKDQYRTWVAIQTLAAWLKQSEANGN